MRRLVPIYLITFIFMSKALQTSISKREKTEKKNLVLKTSLTRKRWSKNVFKMYDAKAKGLFVKEI